MSVWDLDGPSSGPVQWVHASEGRVPPNDLFEGHDPPDEQLFVARTEPKGSVISGKLVPSRGATYVAWGRLENHKKNYEVCILVSICF